MRRTGGRARVRTPQKQLYAGEGAVEGVVRR